MDLSDTEERLELEFIRARRDKLKATNKAKKLKLKFKTNIE